MDGIGLKLGKQSKQYLITEYQLMDAILDHSNIETLGFYTTLKRFINRKDNTKDSQVTYKQSFLEKKMSIGHTKYYRNLKYLYNCGLLDQEKIITVKFFVNLNIADTPNVLMDRSYVFFSSIDNVDIVLKNRLESFISEQENIPKEVIQIVESKILTQYIINEIPLYINDGEPLVLKEIRNYEEDLIRFRKKSVKKGEKEVPYQNGKVVTSQNGNMVTSQNGNCLL